MPKLTDWGNRLLRRLKIRGKLREMGGKERQVGVKAQR